MGKLLAVGYYWVASLSGILYTSKTAILLNGIPGRWMNCKQGLRQGDPMSPYLFILIADVLQRFLKCHGGFKYPLDHQLPCTILQYADDTLVIRRADREDVTTLMTLLGQFSRATGPLHQLWQKHGCAH